MRRGAKIEDQQIDHPRILGNEIINRGQSRKWYLDVYVLARKPDIELWALDTTVDSLTKDANIVSDGEAEVSSVFS